MFPSRSCTIIWIFGMLMLSALASVTYGMCAGMILSTLPEYYFNTFRGAPLPLLTEWLLYIWSAGKIEPGFWLFQVPWLTLVAYTSWQWSNIRHEPWRFLGAWAMALLVDLFFASIIAGVLLLPWIRPSKISPIESSRHQLTFEAENPWLGLGVQWLCWLLGMLAIAGLVMQIRKKINPPFSAR